MSAQDALLEFLPPYLAEVTELLGAARTHLLTAEGAAAKGAASPRQVRELFRGVHTIKGLSAMVDVEPVVALSHRMETSLRLADQAGGRLGTLAIERLFQGLGAIEQRVKQLTEGKPPEAAPEALLELLENLSLPDPASGSTSEPAPLSLQLESALLAKVSASERAQLTQGVAEGRTALLVQFTPSPERSQAGVNINSIRERLAQVAELVKVVPVSAKVTAESPGGLYFALLVLTRKSPEALAQAVGLAGPDVQLVASPPAQEPADALGDLPEAELPAYADAGRHGVVRVEASRLDEAMDRLGALVVGRSRLLRAVTQLTESGVNTRELLQILAENGRQLRDMRASILKIRMVRVGEVLERLPLMVRGLRRSTGKQVRLELELGSAELDKGVGDRLFPAIVHLVRNAVDHAIELPEERIRQGKPAEGLLRIRCHSLPNSRLELVIEDDGRGVDAVQVARRAGAPVPETEAQLLDLICRAGLSTREELSTTSGRGMGMDIVKRIAVDQLGGTLSLATTPGRGTTFTLCVPLTISIVEAFVFESGPQRYALPVSAVDELIELDPAAVIHGPMPGGPGGKEPRAGEAMGMIHRRGAAVPVLTLSALLQGTASGRPRKAIVVFHQGQRVAFGVDRMVSQQEIVIRPLEDPLVRVRGVTGATDLGDGRPTLVLDLAAFARGNTAELPS